MKVVKCMNGHWYDADQYSACPHCGASMGAGERAPAGSAVKTTERSSEIKEAVPRYSETHSADQTELFFSNVDEDRTVSLFAAESVSGTPGSAFSPVEALDLLYETDKTVSLYDNDKTVSLFREDVTNALIRSAGSPEQEEIASAAEETEAGTWESGAAAEEMAPELEETRSDLGEQEGDPEKESLEEAVKQASSNAEGKTMSYFQAAIAERTGIRTVEPITAWLVCVKGPHFGECFRLTSGRNSIGRSSGNQVALLRDNGVSRDRHASVVYEPKKRVFYLEPGGEKGLTYLNDEYISLVQELSPYDMIETGETVMVFIPLCGERFTWDDYM